MALAAHADSPWLAIVDPTRRAMLDRLRGGARRAGDLAVGFKMSQPAVSQHLGVLLRSGLVARERRGREQVYSIQHGALTDVASWVAAYSPFWDKKLAALGTFLAARRASKSPPARSTSPTHRSSPEQAP